MIKDVKLIGNCLSVEMEYWESAINIPVYKEDVIFLMKKLNEFVHNGLDNMLESQFLYMSVDIWDLYSSTGINYTYKIRDCEDHRWSLISDIMQSVQSVLGDDFHITQYYANAHYNISKPYDFRKIRILFYEGRDLPEGCRLVNKNIIGINSIPKIIKDHVFEIESQYLNNYSIFVYKRRNENEDFEAIELQVNNLYSDFIRSLSNNTKNVYMGSVPEADEIKGNVRRMVVIMAGKENIEQHRASINKNLYTFKDCRDKTYSAILKEVNTIFRKGKEK